MTSSSLSSIRLPIGWSGLGFADPIRVSGVDLSEGAPGWRWQGPLPDLAVPEIPATSGTEVDGWGLDHIVLLVPDLVAAADALGAVGHAPRLRMEVKGRPTAFFRVGAVLEVIETEVPFASLYGVALVTAAPLEEVAARWRRAGYEVGSPHEAVQPGRRILSVHGLAAGLAVMSPEAGL